MKLTRPWIAIVACLLLLTAGDSVFALKSDRQQPLDVDADSSDGTLGDGIATMKGNILIRQGTLLIHAEMANVEKTEGKVKRIELTGKPVHLQQEIEEQGLVTAEALKMEYEIATGIVTLSGAADVVHPQYHISGEVLVYDMNLQHFQGSGDQEDGRIRIRLDPEVIPGNIDGSKPEESEQQPEEGTG